jgi:hypothetical protein
MREDSMSEVKKAWRLIYVHNLVWNYFAMPRCPDFRLHLPGSNVFSKGEIIEGHFKEGFMLRLEVLDDTMVCELGDIPRSIRDEWGSPARSKTSVTQVVQQMREYYPDKDVGEISVISVNLLRLPLIGGKPTAGFLPSDLADEAGVHSAESHRMLQVR